MFKKLLIVSTLLFTSYTFANGGTYAPHHIGNFYVGLGIGSEVEKIRYLETDVGLSGVNGRVFGGYGIHWYNGYYTGFELFGTVSSNKGTNGLIPAQIKEKGTWGIRMLPGVHLTDSTIFYANIGYVRGKFSANNEKPFFSNNSWLDGAQVGLGMQTQIASNVSLRGGWNMSGFNRDNSISSRNALNEFYLDAIYHFA